MVEKAFGGNSVWWEDPSPLMRWMTPVNEADAMSSTLIIYKIKRSVIWKALESSHYGGWKNTVPDFFEINSLQPIFYAKYLENVG